MSTSLIFSLVLLLPLQPAQPAISHLDQGFFVRDYIPVVYCA
jgi:hypothetical protein